MKEVFKLLEKRFQNSYSRGGKEWLYRASILGFAIQCLNL